MKLFYTNSAKHLAEKINLKKGKFTIKRFRDGEIAVRIEENVKHRQVWVIASTPAPADNLLELLFLLDALQKASARINLLIPYFGYARQDQQHPGESLSGQVVCDLLKRVKLRKLIVLHMHGKRLQQWLRYQKVIPFPVFYPLLQDMEVVVAPDKGSLTFAQQLSKTGYELACMEKIRPTKEKVKITKWEGKVKNKKVIIVDDMIATGSTIIKASQLLKKQGAKEINVLATHGIFSGNALANIEKSPIKRIWITNSLAQTKHSRKIRVIDITGFLERLIKNA